MTVACWDGVAAKNGALYSVETADGRVAWVRWLNPGLDDLRGE